MGVKNFARKAIRNLKLLRDSSSAKRIIPPAAIAGGVYGTILPMAMSGGYPRPPRKRKDESKEDFRARKKTHEKKLTDYTSRLRKYQLAGLAIGTALGTGAVIRHAAKSRLRLVQSMSHHHLAPAAGGITPGASIAIPGAGAINFPPFTGPAGSNITPILHATPKTIKVESFKGRLIPIEPMFDKGIHKKAGIATFAKTVGSGIGDKMRRAYQAVSSLRRAKATSSKGPLSTRIKNYLKESIVGEKGMVGKNVRQAAKDLSKSPWKTVKQGWRDMDNTEKFIMPILTYDSAKSSVGKLNKGETRLGRMGETAGRLAGYYATPFKRVGMLGNIMLGDIVGATAGRYAGKGISKLTGVGEKAGYSLAQKLSKK